MRKTSLILSMFLMLNGCGILQSIKNIGSPPRLSPIENPVEDKDYKPLTQPMPDEYAKYSNPNSLWQRGSQGFFKDLRASRVGDILTVKISAEDTALMENETEQNQSGVTDSDVNALAGLETTIDTALGTDSSNLLDVKSDKEMSGDGKIDRKESIDVTMAATVIQVLPNGNMVIQGSQEIRVNYEVRQLMVQGIVRRADINAQNTIESSKIADLRVSYGGEGVLSDIQKSSYGTQFLDIVKPF
ncbi:MAG: flagellar basal body L-ring protein FlgH [Alphaproteobacteria bacterium]